MRKKQITDTDDSASDVDLDTDAAEDTGEDTDLDGVDVGPESDTEAEDSGAVGGRGSGTSKPVAERRIITLGEGIGSILARIAGVLSRPLASFHLILTLAVLLTAFGLVMVLSASSVEGYSKTGSSYGMFTTQLVFAALGVVLFFFAVRMPVRIMRRLAAPAIIVTTIMLMLVLVPGIGTMAQGARRWFTVAGFSVQPSELTKVALCVWGAHLLASRRRDNAQLRELLVPLIPVSFLICLLIILEPNLSTTVTIAIIVGALLWFAGLPMKVFGFFALTGVALAAVLAMTAGYRSQRVLSFFGQVDDPQGAGYQARQARYALANGGPFGEGLGQSRAKWNYLPNAHNDFIFAIIGEELGLVGGVIVLLLFGLFAFVGLRIAARSVDPFLRLLTATITILVTAQALINISYVVGLLPVTGIQLPLLSAGGTSTLTTLVMFGLLANAARHEPEAVAALASGGDGRFGRMLRLPHPVPYSQTRAEVLRDRLDQRRVHRAPSPVGRARRTAATEPVRRPSQKRQPPRSYAPRDDIRRVRTARPQDWGYGGTASPPQRRPQPLRNNDSYAHDRQPRDIRRGSNPSARPVYGEDNRYRDPRPRR
ncbi:putative lipid II flippase FtsW [Nocardia sp. 348MFTsu5.1]|uniref:putative lipid II flippase FtsW n=1 Tax=Nocardia sp. 348MFTsu5.1 TaxID=1172185 RepID=UPI00036D1E33|nr:putative lipid II flippase FtsW [Nocardia sp. 348MFTsu5.1]